MTKSPFSAELLGAISKAGKETIEPNMTNRAGRLPKACKKILSIFKGNSRWAKISGDGFLRVAVHYLYNDMKKDKYGTIDKLKQICEDK